jgi:ParB family transcriptional regulator, chromosome partitioning protein
VLSLPEQVQHMVEGGAISTGHARALLALNDAKESLRLASESVVEGLSVRELERRVRELTKPDVPPPSPGRAGPTVDKTSGVSSDPGARRIEDDLRRYLQTDVKIHLTSGAQGRLEVSFYSHDDLERILDLVLRDQRRDY